LIYESHAQAQYDLYFILRDGLKKYGDNPIKLAEYVRTVKDYPGFSGGITIGENGDRVGGHTVKVIRDGKSEAI
jgi:ABC-type branched-subunit amino acid transport system substrate-binding protein